MRQSRIFSSCHFINKRLLFCAILFLFCCVSSNLFAKIIGQLAVETTFSAGSEGETPKLNGQGRIRLKSTWQTDSDTNTSIIRYKRDGTPIGNDTVFGGSGSAEYEIIAANWGHTNGTPQTVTVEVEDSSGSTSTAQSRPFIVDTVAPVPTVDIVSPTTGVSPNGTVRVQIKSDEPILTPTVTCDVGTAQMEGSATPATSYVFNITLSNAPKGKHTVTVDAKDTSVPESSANEIKGVKAEFTVGTDASGNTTIDPINSPTASQTITIKGTAPNGFAKIVIKDGEKEVQTINTSNSPWSIIIQPENGSHSYTATSYDSTGQEISTSQAVTVVVDREPPQKPTYPTEGLPTQTNANSVAFSVTVPDYTSEVAPPVYLQAYVNGAKQGSVYNVTSMGSPLTVNVTLINGTNKITFKAIDAVGNESESSEEYTITRSDSATASASTALVDQYSVPAPEKAFLGNGQHMLTFNFNQAVKDTLPTVEIVCGGGGKIVANPTWSSNMVLTASFTIPANGGSTIDGRASISLKGVIDTFGNTLDTQNFDSAFSIDSTPPTSTMTNSSPVYVSNVNRTVALSGTVDDGSGSGIDYLTLVVVKTGGASATKRIPLQTNELSPWSYNFNLAELEGITLASGDEYSLYTSATDMALKDPNTENISGKTPIKLLVDIDPPEVTRISLNNTGRDIPSSGTPIIIASDVTRLVAVASDTGAGLDLTNANYVFTLTGPNGENITGEKSNNNVDTIYFDFPVLTDAGTYTVSVKPIDKAGNVASDTATRQFVLNKSAPESAEFSPKNQSVANKTQEDLAENQVKVIISSNSAVTPSYNLSTISVKYNGTECGTKVASETEALVAKLHGGDLKEDGSHDGNYYVTVVPRSTTEITGAAINSSFIYDTLPPVIVESSPDLNSASETWFGLSTTQITVKLSDAPKDIMENYKWQYPATLTPQIPGDSAWYGGNGSGINSISSISWKIDGVDASATGVINGSVLSIRVPTKEEASGTTGVASLVMEIITADLVNQGNTVPNTNTIHKVIKYDFQKPTIEIKDTKNAIYCKNVVNIASGTATDAGEGAQIVKVEYSEDNGTSWKSIPISEPTSPLNFKLQLDITNQTEGNHEVKFKATDRGGNESEIVTWSYNVDRTPPDPPELTIPLADYTVNKRTQTFKWTTVASATAYVLQISDDSSFNNILNTQTSTEYPSLKGVVSSITDGSFSFPKDGAFYWRVASLEKCVDGYNISEFTETRKIIIDSVKPYIVSVLPTPSSSNTVSTGMVTFTIRFSEALDSTIDLYATLTSAGGQVMKIEKVNCTGDTWTGTTVIPKNNSAVYDGNAVITVEKATDLAGNIMVNDNSHTIVINTGPAFTTKLFSNPANEYEITIITKSSESLQTAPSVTVKQNGAKTSVTMNFLKDKFYSGSYKIDKENPGSAYINISGTDLYGMVGNSTVEFIVADVNASARLSITDAQGRASLKAAQGSTYTPTAIYMISRDMLESPFSNTSETTSASIRASAGIKASTKTNKTELVGILGLDEVGPSKTKLKKCMLYTADLNGETIDTTKADKIHIYRQDSNGNWIFQGGELKDYKISAQITGLGRLALMLDTTAPKSSSFSPTNNSKLDTNYPEIKGKFADNGSGLLVDSFKLYIDDLQVKNVEMNKDGTFTYQVKQPLKEGKHEIKYEVNDKAGNSLVRAVTVDAPALLREGEFSPYPNPARGNRISFAYNFGVRPESASLKIYDSAGHIVAKFGTEDFDRISGLIRWNLTNQKGKRVANGTYIYRLEVVANGQKIKKRGKFAVLK